MIREREFTWPHRQPCFCVECNTYVGEFVLSMAEVTEEAAADPRAALGRSIRVMCSSFEMMRALGIGDAKRAAAIAALKVGVALGMRFDRETAEPVPATFKQKLQLESKVRNEIEATKPGVDGPGPKTLE